MLSDSCDILRTYQVYILSYSMRGLIESALIRTDYSSIRHSQVHYHKYKSIPHHAE